jgi:hypothetical protein
MSSHPYRTWSLSLSVLLVTTSFLGGAPMTGEIDGRVVRCINSLEAEPVKNVRVEVVGLPMFAMTSEDGSFRLQNVPPGTRQLRVSMVGYSSAVKTVEVEPFVTTRVTILLGNSARCLHHIQRVPLERTPYPVDPLDTDVLTLTENDPILLTELETPDCIPPSECVFSEDGEWVPEDCSQEVCPTLSIDTTVVVVSGRGSDGWLHNHIVEPPIDAPTGLVAQSNTLEFDMPPLEESGGEESGVPWVAAFSVGDAMKLFDDITWTSAWDMHTRALEPNLLTVPLKVWRASSVDVAAVEDALLWAQVLYYENRVGIEFDWIIDTMDDENAVGTNCANVNTLKNDEDNYTVDAINIYFINQNFTSDSLSDSSVDEPDKHGYACYEQGAPEVIFMGTDHSNSTSAHELGHSLGLNEPDYGHASPIAGFASETKNIMVTGTVLRDRFTVGQVFRMNVDQRAWINRETVAGSQIRTGTTLDCACSPHAVEPCPPQTLDFPATVLSEADPPFCAVEIHNTLETEDSDGFIVGDLTPATVCLEISDPSAPLPTDDEKCDEFDNCHDVVATTIKMLPNESSETLDATWLGSWDTARWWSSNKAIASVTRLSESVAWADDDEQTWPLVRIIAESEGVAVVTVFVGGRNDSVEVTVTAGSCPNVSP